MKNYKVLPSNAPKFIQGKWKVVGPGIVFYHITDTKKQAKNIAGDFELIYSAGKIAGLNQASEFLKGLKRKH